MTIETLLDGYGWVEDLDGDGRFDIPKEVEKSNTQK